MVGKFCLKLDSKSELGKFSLKLENSLSKIMIGVRLNSEIIENFRTFDRFCIIFGH